MGKDGDTYSIPYRQASFCGLLETMNKPNFLIVGAPKCGTTAMYQYLAAHPDVYMSALKEPHFFAEDIPGMRQVTTMDKYESLFPHSWQRYRRQGEASVYYLFSNVALGRVREFNPSAQLIIMLRNPVDMALSYHGGELFYGKEDVADFVTAWQLQDQRKKGLAIPAGCRDPELLQYRKVVALGSQVERALAIFPREQVHLVFFDDFVRETRREYEKLLEFLDIPSDGRTEFAKVNPRKVPRMRWWVNLNRRLVGKLPIGVIRLWRGLGLRKITQALVEKKVELSLPSEDFLRQISAELSPEIDKLSDLTARDLDPWKRMEWL
jgi:hypothetical protein